MASGPASALSAMAFTMPPKIQACNGYSASDRVPLLMDMIEVGGGLQEFAIALQSQWREAELLK